MADTVNAYIAASGTDRTSITELSEFITSVESGDLEVVPASLATALGHAAANLDPVAAAYWLSSTYTSMLSDEIRSRLGIYYTPPALSERLLDMVEIAGADWRTSRVLDPACGGGAFLGPVSLRMAESLRDRSPGEIVASIAERLRGYEIDPFAAWLAQVFLEVSLDSVGLASEIGLPRLVQVCDSLQRDPESGSFDVVVGNPPYGRVGLTRALREKFRRGLFGHANLYGVFTDLALRWTAPRGLIAYVTPTSFLAGQYFKALRELLAVEAPPVAVDVVDARQGVFDGVLQETMLSVYRRSGSPTRASVHSISMSPGGRAETAPVGTFTLPAKASGPWLIPRRRDQARLIPRLERLSSRLADWGYQVSTGPLVWNRHKSQLRQYEEPGCAPLVWAEAIAGPGQFVFRAEKKNHSPFIKLLRGDDWLRVDEPCVLLQRTTAKEQRRRLIAATLPLELIDKFSGVVVENHLNMVRPLNGHPKVSLGAAAAFFNSEIADAAFRCISGSVAVSAYELEALPLPPLGAMEEVERLLAGQSNSVSIERCLRAHYLEENS